jgi:hypothetical protein
VTANEGSVGGFRVTAHNLNYKLWYTVFTVKGHYTIPQALPGAYDVSVLERGFTSPTLRIALAPGEDKTADIALEKIGSGGGATQGASTEGMAAAMGGPGVRANTVWVTNHFYPNGYSANAPPEPLKFISRGTSSHKMKGAWPRRLP